MKIRIIIKSALPVFAIGTPKISSIPFDEVA